MEYEPARAELVPDPVRPGPRSGRSGATDAVQTELNWNTDKVRETIVYIKGADRPEGWRVTKFQAVDDAIDDPVRSFPTVDVTRDSIRKPANDVDRWAADSEYQLTQVRAYADDVEQAKTASAWWN